MISVIVCSKSEDEFFQKFSENLQNTIGVTHELIRIDNSKNEHSIFSAYNLGAEKSTMPYLCFVHEDVYFHTTGWGEKIIEHLEKPRTGIVGVAGSPEAGRIPAPWTWGKRYINIIQSDKKNGNRRPKRVVIPASNTLPALPCVLLDGVFLCMKRELMSQIQFDESFAGFHGYDMDIALQSHSSGHINLTAYNVEIEHFSRGFRSKEYYQNLLRLYKKWENELPLYAENLHDKEIVRIEKNERFLLKRLMIKLTAAGFETDEILQIYNEYSKKTAHGKWASSNWIKLQLAVLKLFIHKKTDEYPFINMNRLHVITPVKDSLDTTLKTIESVLNSQTDVGFDYTVYNDFSSEETTQRLEIEADRKGFKLINLKDLTDHESPNYLLILQLAQAAALQDGAHLLIVESDVTIAPNTIKMLQARSAELTDAGLIACVTNDEDGNVNFPYLFAKKYGNKMVKTKKRISFCCTLLSHTFLQTYNFKELDSSKSWFDIHISHQSVKLGFSNYLLMDLPVLHAPHSSRPWKKLKYTNPASYYFNKYFIKNKDKF